MNNIYRYFAILLSSTILYSCTDSENAAIDEGISRDAIAFSATVQKSSVVHPFAAADNFPNSGKIGVIAAQHKADAMDWNSYPDINNAAAIVTANNNGIYSFAWEQVKYWPFDDTKLAFLAYSPVAQTNGAVVLSNDKTSLNLTLENNMPDVLYASANTTPVAYNKSMEKAVELGEFKHALSQLTIKVSADAAADVDLIALEITTPKRKATLNLLQGDNGLTIDANDIFNYKLVSGTQNIIDSPHEKTVLLYPATEDVTRIKLTLKERAGARLEYPFDYMVPFFENTANPSKAISLERGKNTRLTIKVKGRPVTTPAFLLEGAILDWVPKGDFGVIIK